MTESEENRCNADIVRRGCEFTAQQEKEENRDVTLVSIFFILVGLALYFCK